MKLIGKKIVPGKIKAKTIVSSSSISFLGDVDPKTGIIIERTNSLYGKSVADKIFAFPHGKGSTVGSYVIYQLKKNGKAPAAIINFEAEAIVAVGAIISDIPMIQGIDIKKLPENKNIFLNATEGYIEF